MGKYKTMDANEAVSINAYKFSEMCGIYPITPASPMAENIDKLSSNNEKNYFGDIVKVVEMQSEAGAIATVHGALQSGILATTFTASQGLLLMIPSLYKMAGEMLPAVLHVASRSLATHALSIFGDHQDIYATRATGVCLLASSSPNQANHLSNVAHLSAIKGSLPFIHFFDGFRTSHEISKIELLDYDKISNLIDKYALNNFRNKSMQNSNPNTRGTAQNDDIYFQNTEVRNNNYNNVIDIVEDYMNKINEIAKTDYKLFNYYGDINAEKVIVAMGSVCETIKETINYLNMNDKKYGLIEVHLYRPFSQKHLLNILPNTIKEVVVLDRTKEAGSNGEPLYLDIVSALQDKNIKVYGGRYGLSSKNTTPKDIKAIFDYLNNNKMFNNFTIGINDDVTNLSLKVDNNFIIPNNMTEFLIYGYGSDGMVSTSKDIIKIIGDNTNKYVQCYSQYDSKKSGGVTRSNIRISDDYIYANYYIDNPSLIVVSKDSYMYKYDILDNIKENGILLLNTNLNQNKLLKTLPNKIKYLLAKKNISLYIIDAYDLVNKLGLKNKISTCLEICIFKIINILELDKVIEIMKEKNVTRFKNKGNNIIEVNNKVVDSSLVELKKIDIPKEYINIKYEDNKKYTNEEIINNLKGDSLPVSAFLDNNSGIFAPGSTKLEKRDVAEVVPCWHKENCIQCNQCTFVCPHGVIRPFLLNEKNDNIDTTPSIIPKDKEYAISVSYKDCTGCGLCANTCPGKMGKKALTMEINDRNIYKQEKFDYLLNNNSNIAALKIKNVKNIGFTMPKFEFSGACAGCGEAAYIKNLTQMFPNNLMIANATGCSSIYGASSPSTPYSIPWANSLFEDNSEFGLGILMGSNLKRQKIKKYMEENLDKDKELFTNWLDNYDNYDICMEVANKIDYTKHKKLFELKESITPKTIFVIGGDGFAYDIGYGGLDHVLSMNENINILILDTEVYSNTGGQSSKSSNLGSIASFTSKGKTNYKKDLAKIAMCYENVYVATTNIGYDKEQYLKVLKEATSHNGPSLIIAYAPCISHGIKRGMEHSLDNSYLATECGYFLTFRYNPDTKKFIMDSKNIDFNKYIDYLYTENRYASLENINKEAVDSIFNSQKDWAVRRYEYYSKKESE